MNKPRNRLATEITKHEFLGFKFYQFVDTDPKTGRVVHINYTPSGKIGTDLQLLMTELTRLNNRALIDQQESGADGK